MNQIRDFETDQQQLNEWWKIFYDEFYIDHMNHRNYLLDLYHLYYGIDLINFFKYIRKKSCEFVEECKSMNDGDIAFSYYMNEDVFQNNFSNPVGKVDCDTINIRYTLDFKTYDHRITNFYPLLLGKDINERESYIKIYITKDSQNIFICFNKLTIRYLYSANLPDSLQDTGRLFINEIDSTERDNIYYNYKGYIYILSKTPLFDINDLIYFRYLGNIIHHRSLNSKSFLNVAHSNNYINDPISIFPFQLFIKRTIFNKNILKINEFLNQHKETRFSIPNKNDPYFYIAPIAFDHSWCFRTQAGIPSTYDLVNDNYVVLMNKVMSNIYQDNEVYREYYDIYEAMNNYNIYLDSFLKNFKSEK